MVKMAELLVNLLINCEMDYQEGLSTTSHCYQAAKLAKQAGAKRIVILAALFHDIGHVFCVDDTEGCGASNHGEVGATVLSFFGFREEICELVRQHAKAKRYLVTIDKNYGKRLSPASRKTLAHQGGPLTFEEAREFQQHPLFHDIIALRRFDDAAKDTSLPEPSREDILSLLQTSRL